MIGTKLVTALAMPGGVELITTFAMVAIIGAMFFFMWRSNKKQEKQTKDMLASLQVGDEITTIGGIIGKVVSIKEETCVIETSRDCTKIRILKSAVSRIDVKAEDSID